jgi:hypothetical protein
MAKKFTWKAWLRPNLLTKDVDNDYVAEVSTEGNTKHNGDVAKAIKEEGSELSEKTLLDVMDRADIVRRKFVLSGSSVQDGNVRLSPRILGNWQGTKHVFDPATHKLTIDATPTAELRKGIDDEVDVEVLGTKTDGGAEIELVTDSVTGKNDGTITPSGDLIIEGEKIRVLPIDEEGMGVFFVATDGTETPIVHHPTLNDPKRIIVNVPALAAGTYTLKIVTRYSNSSTLLKEPRTIVYRLPLTVV